MKGLVANERLGGRWQVHLGKAASQGRGTVFHSVDEVGARSEKIILTILITIFFTKMMMT